MKKGFIVFMALAMILSYGVVFTGSANAASDGDLIKMDGNSTVYYLNGGKRYVFPNQKTFMTWYANFNGVVTISQSEMEGYPLGGNVTYRPGTRLVKITTVPTVYAVEPGGVLRSIVSEANAIALYGSVWNTIIDDVPDSFFVNYTVGSDLTAGMYPTGTLVKEEGSATTYYVDGSTKRPIATGAAFDANMFNWSYLVTTTALSGYTDGTSITAAEAGLTTVSGTGGGVAQAGSVDVALSSATAPATTIISDTADSSQGLIPFITVNFTAPASGDVVVTNLKFQRTGISADGDIANTYLYDGMTKLAEGGSVSSGIVTFNSSVGLFTVPAGTTKAVTFKIDLTYNTSAGKTMAFRLTEVTTANSATVNGSLPFTGNTMTTASVADLGNVSLTAASACIPTSNSTVNPGEVDFEVYKIAMQANDQDLQLEYLKLTLLGSIDVNDLANISLTKGGVVLATGVLDANRELVFDLSASPYVIVKGQNPTFSVRADVISGSTRTFRFSTEYSSDLVLKDTNYNVYITPFGATAWTAKKHATATTGWTINSGTLAVSLDTSSPTENVPSDATNIKLATFKFEANGEDVKVTNLDIDADTSSGVNGLNNGQIFLDGVQVGTTKDLTDATDTNFTFGSSFIIPAGQVKLVDVYADTKTTTSTAITAGTITISLAAGSSNAQGQASLTSISTGAVTGTALSVSTGSLTLMKYSAYGDQNVVKPATQTKVASFVVSAGAYEGVSIDTINISQATSGVMQNVKLFSGSTQIGSTKVTLTSTSATENVFSVSNLNLSANESRVIDVYADIKSSTGANSIAIVVDLAGTTALTSTAVTATDQTMQAMTITTGSIASSADGSKPDSTIVIAGTTVTMNAVKFTATNEAFTITKLQISEGDSTAYDAIGNVILEYKNKAGNTVTKQYYIDASGDASFTGLDMYVPKDATAVLTIKAQIPTIAAGVESGDAPGLDFDYDSTTFSALGESSNVARTTGPTDVNANNMIVRKTVPTITLVALPTTVLNDGTQTISKFSITADAAGDVFFKELNYTYATTTGVDVTNSTIYLYKYSDQSTALNTAESLTKDGSNALEVVLTSEEVVAAGTSVTYVLKGTISGSASDRSFSTSFKGSAVTTAGTSTTYDLMKLEETGGLLWSDGSASPHSSSSADYADCTYVRNLPTDSQTMSK